MASTFIHIEDIIKQDVFTINAVCENILNEENNAFNEVDHHTQIDTSYQLVIDYPHSALCLFD